MPLLRLAYITEFLIALIAVFVTWSQAGGQAHLDPLPWYVKLGLGGGTALATVKATMEAVSGEKAWNAGSLKWFAILLALLLGCGMASLYSHTYLENDEIPEEETVTSMLR
jgi:hypothetical protein